MTLVEQIYAAAARAGLLKKCTWVSKEGFREVRYAEFRTSDDTAFDNLLLAAETTITYPATYFKSALRGDHFVVGDDFYVIRDIRAIKDGSETKAKVAKA